MIKRFTATLVCALFPCLSELYAQNSLSGHILDTTTRQPVPFVSVALYRLPDSVALNGGITDSSGRFRIADVQSGSYQLKTFFVGYKPESMRVSVSDGQSVDLGSLFLEADSRLLAEVQVTGQRAGVIVKADRQTYRAAQFGSATGGTAGDVLRNLPGMTLNAEGEVSLRGSNGFLVLLNGRPVQANLETLLQQLPANDVEAIEVITTPNARFDPDGKAGIISIVTKKGSEDGWSAIANGMAGLPSVNAFDNARGPRRYGTDATLTYRSARWEVSLATAYLRNDVAGRREGYANTVIGRLFTRFPSDGERSFDRYSFTNRLAVAFIPNKFNAWNLGLYYGRRTEDRIADIFYDNTKINLFTGEIVGRSTYFNQNLVRKQGSFYTANLDYTHTFGNKATLTVGGLYEYDRLSGFTSNRNLNRTDYRDTLQYTLTTTDRPIRNARANLDGSLPVGNGRLEAGYQYRYQQDTGDYLYREQNGNGEPLPVVPAFSGRVVISNDIHSWYSQFVRSTKKLEYTVGLRYEHSVRRLLAPDGRLYPLTLNNLFPSFNLLFRAQEGLSLKTGYSRRIQRSSNFALNPLPEREHSETLEQGDPNLLPEFVDLAEVGMTKNLGGSTLVTTLYYQGIRNIINRVNRVYTDSILSRIFTNAGTARRFGLEVAADLRLTKAWKLYLGGNVNRFTLAGQLFYNEVVYNRAAWVYSVNANTSYQLTPTFSLQASVNYLSRRITAQGEDSRLLIPNFLAKKSLLKNRLTLTAQWQNIGLGLLPTNEQRITTRGRNFFTTTNYIQEKDIFLLNVSYTLRQPGKRAKLPGSEFGDQEF